VSLAPIPVTLSTQPTAAQHAAPAAWRMCTTPFGAAIRVPVNARTTPAQRIQSASMGPSAGGAIVASCMAANWYIGGSYGVASGLAALTVRWPRPSHLAGAADRYVQHQLRGQVSRLAQRSYQTRDWRAPPGPA